MPPPPQGGVRVTGQVKTVSEPNFLLVLRDGRSIQVDATQALRKQLSVIVYPGALVMAEGSLSPDGRLSAVQVLRAKTSPASWLPDIP